ncbi:esterase/lipase family protein [Sporobolomyces salmoneus]|uniref:esterase/lipase family protein n=1 Tax=Sporobolomyces salmoneus TaxID=183962 RepID=UPI00317FF738
MSDTTTTSAGSRELVIGTFVHGFKGGSDTFADFPQRLRAILAPSGIEFEPVVYPPFDTRGELRVAVDNHITWLINVVAEKKAEYRSRGGTGQVRLILLGHSMGGLVISDTLLSTLSSASLPILGLIAYDSPLLGLNPRVFKSTFDKAMDWTSKGQAVLTTLGAGYGLFKSATGSTTQKEQASTPTSSTSASKGKGKSKEVTTTTDSKSETSSTGWGFLASSVLAGTAAAAVVGAGWYNRDKLVEHWTWATSHLSFVGELWKVSELEQRLEDVVSCREKGIGFHCFYTLHPPNPSSPAARTFLILPTKPAQLSLFTPSTNTRADGEIQAHVEMFDKSDGVYDLGRETARLISEWVESARKGEMGYWEGDPEAEKEKEDEKEKDERMV